MKNRILVVEDDENLSALLRENLAFEGFDVKVVADGLKAIESARTFLPHLIVLDLMLPGMNGFELCTTLRRNGRTPILIVSARSQKNDRIRGLTLGADDYLVKPFEIEEFLARVNAILRRARPSAEDLRLGPVRVDFRSHTAYRGDQELHLTHREFDLLKYLSERAGQVVSRNELLRDLWEYPDPGLTRSVDHAIGRLRRKIEVDPQQPRFIHTSVGHGYVLTPDGRTSPSGPVDNLGD
jgi:DNA-binding response OmpR family regulator